MRDGEGAHRAEYDAMVPRTAVDAAFVAALRGAPVPPEQDGPDHAEALRSHRLACALARSAGSGHAELVR